MDASTPDVPIACSLSAAEYYRRLGEFQHLFAVALATFRRERARLLITLEATQEVEASAAEVLSREKECCPFFSFELSRDGDELLFSLRYRTKQTYVWTTWNGSPSR